MKHIPNVDCIIGGSMPKLEFVPNAWNLMEIALCSCIVAHQDLVSIFRPKLPELDEKVEHCHCPGFGAHIQVGVTWSAQADPIGC